MQICEKKKQFYDAEIGGNPRKESQRWDSESNEIFLEVLPKDQFPEEASVKSLEQDDHQDYHIASNGNHWLDSELPL